MTTREFIERWYGVDDGKERWCSSVKKDGKGNIYSYGSHYPLLFQVDGHAFRNVSGYSVTTGRHISWTYSVDAINVQLSRSDIDRLRFWNDTSTNLGIIAGALKREIDQIEALRASKKRKNTQTYTNIVSDLKDAQGRLERVRGLSNTIGVL